MSIEHTNTALEQREALERQTEVYDGVKEAIYLQRKIGEGASRVYQDVKDGKIDSMSKFEKSIQGIEALHYDRSSNKLEEGSIASGNFQLAETLLNPNSGLDSLESTTLHSMNTLLEMAWEVKERSKRERSAKELSEEYALSWNLTEPEQEMVFQLSTMKASEFDNVQHALVDSGLALAVTEEVYRIIDSGELPASTEDEEKEKAEKLEKAEKDEAWKETKTKLVEAHEDLEGVDFTEENIERALVLANSKRLEILAILRTCAFVRLEDIPELTERYTMDNLDNSKWLLSYLISFDARPRRDLFTTKDKKFHTELESRINGYLGQKLHEHRKGLLKGYISIYGAALTDPESEMHKDTFAALHELARESASDDPERMEKTGATIRTAFNQHYSVRLDAETQIANGVFKTKEAKERFKTAWVSYIEDGKKRLKNIGEVVRKELISNGSDDVEVDDSEKAETIAIDIEELLKDGKKS